MDEYMKPGLLGLAALAVIGVAGPAGLATGLRAYALRPVQTAAASVASRFPSGEIGSSRSVSSDVVPAQVAESGLAPSVLSPVLWREPWFVASASPTGGELFNPVPSFPLGPAAAAEVPAASTGPGAAPDGALAAEPLRHRTAYHPKSVLDDAQIAAIKKRLNLTSEQEAMWPPVEAALRKISYLRNATDTQNRHAQQSSTRLAFIDPDSTEVRQLKYAALPLFMRLNDDQKREVNSLAYVMGLSKVAPD
jgi:hypothetical protein